MPKFLHVVGARPNFMKVAPVYRALAAKPGTEQVMVHTGQHYDFNMSDVFFQQLRLPAPDINLKVGSGSHAQQTAEIMMRFESVVLEQKPDCVLVYGDVNGTAAAALVCSKLHVRVARVEAGLRSGDRRMPEEINRIVTDGLSDLLFTPSVDGNENLAREGAASSRIHFVGNVMIDTLIDMLPVARAAALPDLPERYILVTLHRPSNVDDLPWLAEMMKVLAEIGKACPVLFPVHPRTRERLGNSGLATAKGASLRLLDPAPYVEFLAMQMRATAVITDSGGIQEETTYLGVPCLTMRENTERPITTTIGTNVLIGRDLSRMQTELERVLKGNKPAAETPPLWDGKAGERIAEVLGRPSA